MNATAAPATTLFYEALRYQVDVKRKQVLLDIDKQLRKSGRFVALRGTTGGGKSYFLRHQLVPHYESLGRSYPGGTEGPWRVAAFSPQVNPIGTLAAALAMPGVLKEDGDIQPFYREKIEKQLRAGNDGLLRVFRESTESSARPIRLLIVVDQLEDMFKMGDELKRGRNPRYTGLGEYFQPGDDTLFFNLFLKVLSTEIPIYVIFSIGSENLDRINAYQGWPERISMQRYALAQITPEETERELMSFWPATEEEPMPAGMRTLYEEILRDYRAQYAAGKEPAARLNIALKTLYTRGSQLLDRPFAALEAPPDFVTRALADGQHPSDRAAGLRKAFMKDDNRAKWSAYRDDLSAEQTKRWDEEVALFYEHLRWYYQEFGGLAGTPNFLFNNLYARLTDEQKALTRRLVQTITRKDASPDRVAESYSTPFGTLVQVCFRSGEEYPALLQELHVGTQLTDEEEADTIPAEDQLRALIKTFNFTGGIVPDLVRWVDPAGQIGSSEDVFLHDKMIIKLGTSSLIQEWDLLAKWVDEEFAAANIYRKLVQDAKLYFADEVESSLPQSTDNSTGKPAIPRLSLWRDSLAKVTGLFSQLWHGDNDDKNGQQKPNRLLLSEGGVELVGQWYLNTMPNVAWATKYREEEILSDATAADPSPFQEWIKKGEWKAFSLANAFWTQSHNWHQRRRRNEAAQIEQRIKAQRRNTRIFGGLAAVAIACTIAAVVLGLQANNERNNLRLLDFVDSMTKANLIPSDIYRSAEFKTLKEEIEENNKIKTKTQVIDVLAKGNVVDFPPPGANDEYKELSTLALLQLDSLIDGYHLGGDTKLETLTGSILKTSNQAIAANKADTGKNYQYPYLYHLLWEDLGLLKSVSSNQVEDNADDRGVVFTTPSRITSVVSNPQVFDQYATADATGQVLIFHQGDRSFTRVKPIPKIISSLRYSRDGRSLYATTYSGDIFRYNRLRSGATEKSPFGRTDSLKWEKLTIDWGKRGDDLAILNVLNTADPNYLMVIGDTDLTLIRRIRDNFYREAKNFPVGDELASLTVSESNEEGTLFLIGGSNASVLVHFDAKTKKASKIRVVYHPNISVSAIAFQPSTASTSKPGLAEASPAAAPSKIAVGTETGDIWLTDVSAFQATGDQQELLMEMIDQRTESNGIFNYQQSAITGLAFNQAGNQQLISSSFDGTIWVFNLDVVPPVPSNFLDHNSGGDDWDHLRLIATGRSVDNICLVNTDKLIAIENNTIRNWPTNLEKLRSKIEEIAPRDKE